MTEPKIEIQSADKQAASANKPAPETAKPLPSSGKPKRKPVLGMAFAAVLVIAAVLAAVVWYQHRQRLEMQQTLAAQVQDSLAQARQAAREAQEALATVRAQGEKIAALQSQLQDSGDQLASLEEALRLLTDEGSNELLINEIDHLIQLAHQQLTLSGNVGNAIIALETAQAQLARSNQPSLAALQQAINGDLDRLRAVATVDVPRLSRQLEDLAALVSRAPLLIPDDAAPTVETASVAGSKPTPAATATVDASAPWWRRGLDRAERWAGEAWTMLRQDVRGLVDVRRVSDSAALLMSPSQAGQLRENLRLRVMTAQLALMMRQPEIWTSELQAVGTALETHFDGQSERTRQARSLVQRMADTPIRVKLPTVANSMQAVEAIRAASVKAAQQADGVSSMDAAPGSDAESAPSQPDAPSEGGPSAESLPPASQAHSPSLQAAPAGSQE